MPALARGILKAKNCHQSRCAIGDVYVPRLDGEFLATENFFYSAQFFDLPPSPTLAQIRAAGEQYCSQDWAALQAGHAGKSEEELLKEMHDEKEQLGYTKRVKTSIGTPLNSME